MKAKVPFLMIESTANPQVKAVRGLYEKKQRHLENRFILEGERLVRDGLYSKLSFVKCFVTSMLMPLFISDLESLAEKGTEVYIVADQVLEKLSSTKSPQGILAVAEIPRFVFNASSSFLVLLDGVKDPGNAGTLIRSAEASGADAVIFSAGCVDPFNEKVVRSGMGAHFRIPICTDWTVPDFEKNLKGFDFYLADLRGNLSYTGVNWMKKSVLVIGGEANGASQEIKKHSISIKIPMHGKVESLNAAMAGTIIMFEAMRQKNNNP